MKEEGGWGGEGKGKEGKVERKVGKGEGKRDKKGEGVRMEGQ